MQRQLKGAPVRFLVWAFHLALPMAGLALLRREPHLDVEVYHNPSHFWLVLGVAVVSVMLAVRINEAARRRADARLFLVALAFATSAAFLGLHAVATPTILVHHPSAGFVLANPVGLVLAGVFALASSLDFPPRRAALVLRHARTLRGVVLVVVLTWATLSVLDAPPLSAAPPVEELRGPLAGLALVGLVLYSVAAFRYYLIYRRRRAVMLLSVITAYVLFAEALVAVLEARAYHLSWWEWHVLMALGFGYVAYSAYVQYRREGAAHGLFEVIGTEQTAWALRAEYGVALEALVDAIRRSDAGELSEAELGLITAGVASRFELSEGQVAVLGRAATLYRQLDALFRQYLSPDVATALLTDPSQARLGGTVVEVTALFADLRGFTTFSERSSPQEIVAMLNRYFGVATERILAEGGTVVQFVGDALMALFNAPVRQPDHAHRAARAALAIQAATEPLRAERPDWPLFRIGINTGDALVGNIGSEALRNFNAMGDAVNVAARLETIAEPGQVVIGAHTYAQLNRAAEVVSLGELAVKGRAGRVRAYILRALAEPSPSSRMAGS